MPAEATTATPNPVTVSVNDKTKWLDFGECLVTESRYAVTVAGGAATCGHSATLTLAGIGGGRTLASCSLTDGVGELDLRTEGVRGVADGFRAGSRMAFSAQLACLDEGAEQVVAGGRVAVLVALGASGAGTGGGLSQEDREKLDGIEEGAQKNIKPDWNAASGSAAEILNKPPEVQTATATTAGKVKLEDDHTSSRSDSDGYAATPFAVRQTFIQATKRQPIWRRQVADFGGVTYGDPYIPAFWFPLKVQLASDKFVEFRNARATPVVDGVKYSLELRDEVSLFLYLYENAGTSEGENRSQLAEWATEDTDRWTAANSMDAQYDWRIAGASFDDSFSIPDLPKSRRTVLLQPYTVNMSQPHDGCEVVVGINDVSDYASDQGITVMLPSEKPRAAVWVLDCTDAADTPTLVWPCGACGADRPETGGEADENLVALPGKVNVFCIRELEPDGERWLVKRYVYGGSVADGSSSFGGGGSSSSSGSSGGGGGGTLTTAYYSDGTSRSYWMGYLANESDWYDALYDAFNPYASEKITRIVVGDEVEDGGFDLEALLEWL